MSSPIKPKNRGRALVIVLIIVAVIAIVGAVAFVFINNKNAASSVKNVFHTTITANTPSTVKALLTEAKAGKYDAKCTYTSSGAKSADSTIYVSGATKLRVDTPISGKPGHLLRLDDSAYLWADGDSTGSILPMSSAGEKSQYSPESLESKVDEYHMTCQSVGHVDDSLFTKPSGVTFTDFTPVKSSSSYGN